MSAGPVRSRAPSPTDRPEAVPVSKVCGSPEPMAAHSPRTATPAVARVTSARLVVARMGGAISAAMGAASMASPDYRGSLWASLGDNA